MLRGRSGSQLNEILPVPIELNEGETIEAHTHNHTSHITDVLVSSYHSVESPHHQSQSYIVWQITITVNDLDFSSIKLYKRYSEIYQLYLDLKQVYGDGSAGVKVPAPPPKDIWSLERVYMSKRWLEERRKGLQWFLSSVLLDPVMQRSSVVKSFVLS
ncbi:uncharacterized protein LODBEIA_P55530 [Lodderomyces beijingensis]|uniref:Endosomal/vacuolar adapter protein YPT35 n=1 Tax=Lodderomyces beijingensis TaxID=1775926 RepID=A0ABP0ZTV9_9ASCO